MSINLFLNEYKKISQTKSASEIAQWLADQKESYDKQYPQDILGRSRLYHEIGNFYRSQGLYQETEKSYNKAKKLLYDSDMNQTEEYAILWNDIAVLYMLEGQTDLSGSSFKYSLTLLETANVSSPEQIVYCYNNYAMLKQDTLNNAEAVKLLEQVSKEISEVSNPMLKISYYCNLAYSTLACSERTNAEEAIDKALHIYHQYGLNDALLYNQCIAMKNWIENKTI